MTTILCALSELDDGVARRFEVDGTPVAVVRLGDRVYAISDTCSHAEVSLSEGDVDPEECALECPAHGSLFSLANGEALCLPAVRAVPVHSVRVAGDEVVIDQ